MSVKNKTHLMAVFILIVSSLLFLMGASNNKTEDSSSVKIRVGALFYNNNIERHTCSGSVIDSATKNLVLTAAHCISGTGNGMAFAPGYDKGAAPFGYWKIDKIFVPDKWRTNQDPKYDYAILKLSKNNMKQNIEDYTGGFAINANNKNNISINAPSYNAGSNDSPIDCTTKTFIKNGYPAFNCQNYKSGVSGGPMLNKNNERNYIVGVIGGLEQGGCTDDTSYSSPLDINVINNLKDKAIKNANSDLAPQPSEPNCIATG